MERRLETATEALPELESPGGAESTPELLDARELLNANEKGLRAPNDGEVCLPKWDEGRTQAARLRKLRLLWARAAINVALGHDPMLRSNTAGASCSQTIRLVGEVDTAGSTIGQQLWLVWFDWGRFIGRQQH